MKLLKISLRQSLVTGFLLFGLSFAGFAGEESLKETLEKIIRANIKRFESMPAIRLKYSVDGNQSEDSKAATGGFYGNRSQPSHRR